MEGDLYLALTEYLRIDQIVAGVFFRGKSVEAASVLA
jgi:hypothetical protein